jgi:putative selenium metabolism hydrolase
MIYAAKIIRDMKLEDDYTLLVTGTVMEENGTDYAGKHHEHDGVRPEFALLTEPSDGCNPPGPARPHGDLCKDARRQLPWSTPYLGSNAVYRMAPVIAAVERLNEQMTDDGVLGKGSITISEISSTSPSRCAVADSCPVSLDRRLNARETPEFALAQLRALPEVEQAQATVELYRFEQPS